MSAYIVNRETIHAIVKGFELYNAEFKAENYQKPIQIIINMKELRDGIGQALLNQNYKSVNYRYSDDMPTPTYTYKDVKINEGILYGCIECYIYQACETRDFFESDLYRSLLRLKDRMLESMIQEKGHEMPWGYEV